MPCGSVFNCALTFLMLDGYKINDTGYALKISRNLSTELQFVCLNIFSSAGQYASVLLLACHPHVIFIQMVTSELGLHSFHGPRRLCARLVSY